MSSSERFAFLRLTPGIRRHNFLGVLLGVFCMSLCFVGSNTVQPWLLEHHVHVPRELMGNVTGWLGAIGQVLTVVLAGAFGVLADIRGRRLFVVFGAAVMALALLVAPFAGTVPTLLVSRAVFAVGRGALAACFSAVIADYVLTADLGKAGAMQGTVFGIGAMVAVMVILRLPKWLMAAGRDAVFAGRVTYGTMAAAAAALSIILAFMLAKDDRRPGPERPGFLALVRGGVESARRSGVALSYAAAFAANANMAIVGSFVSLWTLSWARQTQAISEGSALALAGTLMLVMQISSLCSMPVFGPLLDRLGHLRGLQLALGVSALGYAGTGLVSDPRSALMYTAAVVMGVGYAGALISSQAFAQAQAPAEIRGTVLGFAAVSGGMGAVVSMAAGGLLFDRWRASGPFVLCGLFDACVLVAALGLERRIREEAQPASVAAPAAVSQP